MVVKLIGQDVKHHFTMTLLDSTQLYLTAQVGKASSECIDHDTEVCKGIPIIRGHFVTIYGY